MIERFMHDTHLVSVDSALEEHVQPHQADDSKLGMVRVTVGETLALMMHAARLNRVWLSDFAEDTMMVSQDMYEILVAYKRLAHEENRKVA
ncbi:MAG: hypothetical protein AB8B50_12200 [Pirellulaceae bacterium]